MLTCPRCEDLSEPDAVNCATCGYRLVLFTEPCPPPELSELPGVLGDAVRRLFAEKGLDPQPLVEALRRQGASL